MTFIRLFITGTEGLSLKVNSNKVVEAIAHRGVKVIFEDSGKEKSQYLYYGRGTFLVNSNGYLEPINVPGDIAMPYTALLVEESHKEGFEGIKNILPDYEKIERVSNFMVVRDGVSDIINMIANLRRDRKRSIFSDKELRDMATSGKTPTSYSLEVHGGIDEKSFKKDDMKFLISKRRELPFAVGRDGIYTYTGGTK